MITTKLADEPTGNLDTESSDQVFQLLRERNERSDTAFLVVTHNSELARRCDRIIELVDGRVVYDGPPPPAGDPPGERQRG